METYIELFQQNGGPEMFIKARDYENELDQIELEDLWNPNQELAAEKADALKRKQEYSDILHKELEEMRTDKLKNQDEFTIEKSKFDLDDVTENYFENIMNLTTNQPFQLPDFPDKLKS